MNIDLDFKIIGLRIQKRRTEMKMTQAELAERIDTNQKHLSRIEGGYHRCTLDLIVAIAKALDVSVDYLIEYKDETSCEISTTSYHPTSTEHRLLSYYKKLSPNLQNIIFDLVQESALSPKEREEMETDDNETIESDMFEESCSILEENKNDETEK